MYRSLDSNARDAPAGSILDTLSIGFNEDDQKEMRELAVKPSAVDAPGSLAAFVR